MWLLARLRFIVYAAILIAGGMHLAPRVADGSLIDGVPDEAADPIVTGVARSFHSGLELTGQTAQQERVTLFVQAGKVWYAYASYTGGCPERWFWVQDTEPHRFVHAGRRFAAQYSKRDTLGPGRFRAYIQGELSADLRHARGSFAAAHEGSRSACSSGHVTWTAHERLP